MDESRRTLAVIEGQMSYQQAFPKYAQMMAEAGSGSVRPGCEVNPSLREVDAWQYSWDYAWLQGGEILKAFWDNTEFKIGGGFGVGGKVKALAGAEVVYILWGGEFTYNSVDGFVDTTKFSDLSISLGLSKKGFMELNGSVGFHAPSEEIDQYGAIFAPNGSWDAGFGANAWGNIGLNIETDSQNYTSDTIISVGQGAYLGLGIEYDVAFNLTNFIEELKEILNE